MSGAHDHPVHAASPGFLERRDARAKLLAAFALILGVVLVPRGDAPRLAACAAPVLAWASLGGAPPWRVLARATVVLPFAVLAVSLLPFTTPGRPVLGPLTDEGLARAADVVARALLSGIVLSSLALATELADLVHGLAGIGMPRAVVLTTAFTVRYLALLRDEMRRLQLARELRTFEWRPRLALRAMGHAAGTLFLRTFERAERVHAAMVARGFEGRFPRLAPSRLGAWDLALVAAATGATSLLLLARTR